MNIDLYLKKLKLDKNTPNLDFLNELITRHQGMISFNNLAVFYHPQTILNLEIEALFEKVVLRGEGGYCFENNKVFYYLLHELGFEVEAKMGRVIYDKKENIPRTHRMTLVKIQGVKYLVDVGFGRDVPPQAIPIGKQNFSDHHVIVQDGQYLHQFLKNDAIINLYSFDDGTYDEADFMVANYYTNTHPDSKFRKEVMVVRKEKDLLEFINNKTYTKIIKGQREDFRIEDQSDFQNYLNHFGIKQVFDFSKIQEA